MAMKRTRTFIAKMKPSEYLLFSQLAARYDLTLSETFRRLVLQRALKEKLTEEKTL